MPNNTQDGAIEGNWPTDIFDDQKARFKTALGPRFETELKPLQDKLLTHKHPWNFIRNAVLIGGIMLQGLLFFGFSSGMFTSSHNLAGQPSVPDNVLLFGFIATGLGTLGAHIVASKKNKMQKTLNAELDSFIHEAVGLNMHDVSHTHQSTLQTFQQAGFIGQFDRMHYLVGLGPSNAANMPPQSIGTKLTRTETETYTDAEGRTRTRRRIVKVFEGLMLEMDITDFNSDNRILITSRRTHRFSGPFSRAVNGKRHKMDKVKTASVEFNKVYKVRTDDSTLAHLFLDPVRVMRLNNLYDDLQQILDKKRVSLSIVITKGRAWIVLETNGLPHMQGLSRGEDVLDKEIGHVIGQAALPHIIAKHLDWPSPMPYAWQDYITKNESP